MLSLAGAVPLAALLPQPSVAPDVLGSLGGSGKDLGAAVDAPGRGIAGWDGEKSL